MSGTAPAKLLGPCLAAALALTCGPGGRAEDGVSVVFQLDPAVSRVGTSRIDVRLVDAGGEPLTGGDVALEANMNHAGMTPTFAVAAESSTQPGLYRGEVEFTMGGDWFLLLEARLPDGRIVERQLDVPGVRP